MVGRAAPESDEPVSWQEQSEQQDVESLTEGDQTGVVSDLDQEAVA